MRQTNASHAEAQLLIPQGAQANPVKVPGASITSILTPPLAKCSVLQRKNQKSWEVQRRLVKPLFEKKENFSGNRVCKA